MPPEDRADRTELVIRAWYEDDIGQDQVLRGSISTLNGLRTVYFIGVDQLVQRVTDVLQSTLKMGRSQ